MIIIADSPRPHKRILQKGRGGRGRQRKGLGKGKRNGAQPKPPCGRFLRPSAAAAAPPPGAAPRSLPLLHTLPGGRLAGPASSRKPAKKAGQGRGSLSRRGNPAESPGIGPQARQRLRRRRRRQSLRAPAAPSAPPTQAKPACPGCAGAACGPPPRPCHLPPPKCRPSPGTAPAVPTTHPQKPQKSAAPTGTALSA